MNTCTPETTMRSHNNPELVPASVPEASASLVPATTPPQHSGPVVPSQNQSPCLEPRAPSSVDTARNLVPPGIRDRKFRALSFGAKLNPVQRTMLTVWLLSGESIDNVRQKVAAPPPSGFGMNVCETTLRRLQAIVKNSEFTDWVGESMDTACDLLDSEVAGEVEPLRHALSLMLYSRALHAAKEQDNVVYLDRLLSILTKIERLKKPSPRSRRTAPAHPVTTRHLVELSVSPLPGKVVQVSAIPLPVNTSANDERVPENNQADR